MTLFEIVILALIAAMVGRLGKGRTLTLLAVSALVLYWLQPRQEPANLTFWFPTLTLAMAAISWLVTSTPETRGWKENRWAVMVLLAVVIVSDLNRYFQLKFLSVVEPPRFQWVAIAIIGILVIVLVLSRAEKLLPVALIGITVGLIVLLLILKTPSLAGRLVEIVAHIRGKEAGGQSALAWLGFSYVAFRLMHTTLDRRAGRLAAASLADYMNYVIFFPAITAGPIDRLERFLGDLHQPVVLGQEGWVYAGSRFFSGLFKKFVIADGLAWLAINEAFARDLQFPPSMWILLYAYSLRIYFDFSGYTDIAIGLGRLMGVQLPENFASPYLKPNLTQFWNSWHITLTQWFRPYFFNPLTRAMRSAKRPLPPWLMVFIGQIATMILIGLWHGTTIGFIIWGLWHGLGLFIQNRWSAWSRSRMPAWGTSPVGASVLNVLGVLLTFHFVSLGWLFFTFQDTRLAWDVMLKLIGVA